jgi:hypothetical protein
MTYLNLQSDGNNVFSMEDRMHAFHTKLFLYQGGIKSGNLSVFPSVMDFRDKNDRTDHLLELKPTLGSTWTIYHSNSCYITHSSERTLVVEINGLFRHSVRMLPLKLNSQKIFKII